jgi:hypothetical protein
VTTTPAAGKHGPTGDTRRCTLLQDRCQAVHPASLNTLGSHMLLRRGLGSGHRAWNSTVGRPLGYKGPKPPGAGGPQCRARLSTGDIAGGSLARWLASRQKPGSTQGRWSTPLGNWSQHSTLLMCCVRAKGGLDMAGCKWCVTGVSRQYMDMPYVDPRRSHHKHNTIRRAQQHPAAAEVRKLNQSKNKGRRGLQARAPGSRQSHGNGPCAPPNLLATMVLRAGAASSSTQATACRSVAWSALEGTVAARGAKPDWPVLQYHRRRRSQGHTQPQKECTPQAAPKTRHAPLLRQVTSKKTMLCQVGPLPSWCHPSDTSTPIIPCFTTDPPASRTHETAPVPDLQHYPSCQT